MAASGTGPLRRGVRAPTPLVGVLLLAAALVPLRAAADDAPFRLGLGGFLDLRLARTDTTAGWLDRGLGKVRFGGEAGERQTVLALAQASLLVRPSLGESLRAHVQVNVDTGSYPVHGLAGVDLVEAYLAYRPRLSDAFGLKLRGGHFFPPLSLENDGPAWSPTRTLTASAADSWLGEEVRVTGLEGSLELFLPRADVALTGAVFGWNDPSGSLLAWRGWGIGDRQTGLTDRLPLPPLPAFEPSGPFRFQEPWVAPFREVDGRAGFYLAASGSLPELLDVRLLHYDNRGEPTAIEGGQYAWMTRFDAASARLALPGGVELLGQVLDGWSVMGRDEAVDLYFRTWSLLASARRGPHRLSLRYERFEAWDEGRLEEVDPKGEDGDAWTAAWAFEVDRRTSLLLEVLSVQSTRPARAQLGLPERARETLVQLAVRGRF